MANVPLKSLVFPGLDPTYTVPQKTSDLTNDSGFVNASGAASAAPVQSVNGQTGTVVLDADDVGALPEDTPIPEAYNFNVTSQFNMGWAENYFIGTSDGAWKTNSSYPYDYGAQGFLAVSNQSPLAVTMGDDAMQFRAFFYSSNSANAYLGCTSFFGGGKTTVLNGKYNNYTYSHVRFVVQRADHSYSTDVFNALSAAFTLLSSTDTSLSVKRAAADAKTVGDALAAKIPAPSNPATGAFLVYNGSAWVARVESEEVTISTAGAVTQALDAGKIYHFTGALSSLTLTFNAAGTGVIAQYHFDFDSGSTPPAVTLPAAVTMQGGAFTPEANTHYEVDILNGYGVYVAW